MKGTQIKTGKLRQSHKSCSPRLPPLLFLVEVEVERAGPQERELGGANKQNRRGAGTQKKTLSCVIVITTDDSPDLTVVIKRPFGVKFLDIRTS
jgi:hypothetical protein